MSTPPTWPAPDQDRPDPFAAPAPTAPADPPPAAPAEDASRSPYGPPWAEPASPYAAPYPPTPPYGGGSPYGAPPAGAGGPVPPYSGPSYGGPPYGAPPYGGPPPGHPQAPGGYYPPPGAWGPPQPPVDGLAIGSLVTSCVGLITMGLTGIVGLGLGIAALVRIRRSGARGRGLAIAGIAVGGAMTLLVAGFAALVVVGLNSESTYDDDVEWSTSWEDSLEQQDAEDDAWSSQDDATSADVPVYELAGPFTAGQCLDGWPELYDMSDAVVVDCAEAHTTEVIGAIELASAPWAMSDDPAVDRAWTTCWDQVDAMAPSLTSAWGTVDVYYPHPSYWDGGQRSGYCLAISDTDMTGSVVAQTLDLGQGSPS